MNLFFIGLPISFGIGSIMIPKLLVGIHRRAVMMASVLLLVPAIMMLGPSTLLPEKVQIMFAGQVAIGVVLVGIALNALPEMVEVSCEKYPLLSGASLSLMNDQSSGLQRMVYGSAYFTANIFGSRMYELVGFNVTADTVAFASLVLAVLYYTLCEGQRVFKESFFSTLEPV